MTKKEIRHEIANLNREIKGLNAEWLYYLELADDYEVRMEERENDISDLEYQLTLPINERD